MFKLILQYIESISRSFEEEKHQTKLQDTFNEKFKFTQVYNHYNTFHGSSSTSSILKNISHDLKINRFYF